MKTTLTEVCPPLPLDELLAEIANFPSCSMTEKLHLVNRLVNLHPIVNFEWGPDGGFRRARLLGANEDLPSNVDGLIWRKNSPAALGRANPEGVHVFYLADRVETALSEVRACSDIAVLSEFEILPATSVRLAPIGEFTKLQRTGYGFLSGRISTALSSILNRCEPDAAKALLITDAFLLDCLSGPEDAYNVSSSVAMSIFDKLPAISAIVYPSYRQRDALCLAVRVSDFWSKWGISTVRCAHASHLSHGYYKLSETRRVTGITVRGMLQWDDRTSVEGSSILLRRRCTPGS
ncbi:MAG: RES domain-containing protein [Betaproteobacteria bacterium]|uniref:RES domain-containing protein n=1 Tax=Candidatus Proximibacter danicus TaxID=2954365 RepID=A0A9D7K3L8_9PROT|nr:RES domain-containing protein [Candidatus Proximibacter danicus]